MTYNTVDEVIQAIKTYEVAPNWVKVARVNSAKLNALVTGKDFDKLLIERIEHIESDARKQARKKYSKDIRDVSARILQPRKNVFSASGGTNKNEIATQTNRDKFDAMMTEFKGQKSIKHYLSENYFQLLDIDPNGIIFMEYEGDKDIYPTYKAIKDIRYYKSNGQLTEVVIFEPTDQKDVNGTPYKEWRVVDDVTDWRIKQIGTTYTLIEDKTFPHPFGMPPAIILSERTIVGEEVRLSTINDIVNKLEDYARDTSVLTIYKFQNGFPIHFRYKQTCKSCKGTGKTGTKGQETACKRCNGGSKKNDVTDIIEIETPRDKDDPVLANDLAGFISPDLATWTQYKEELKDFEDTMDSTYWGTRRITEATNETATGRFIDVQPVINKLSYLSNMVEWAHNQMAYFVEDWVNGSPVEKTQVQFTYGKRFIIESADTIMDKYDEARNSGANTTILDKLLDEYLLAKYQNNLTNLTIAQKKRKVEPYIHQSITEVDNIFGAKEANKKVLFVDFWEDGTVDKSKSVDEIQNEFDEYVREYNKGAQQTEEERVITAINSLSPLVATKVIEEMSAQQILDLISLKVDPNKVKEPVNNSFNN